MPGQNARNESGDPTRGPSSHYDLVVIGAGIAGLNALHAALVYLPPDARVLLIDAKDRPGGMWTMAYDYVRLHQPHPLFTVGAASWKWRKPRQYLAQRDEVQQHLAGCLGAMLERFDVQECFGHFASDVREVQRSGAWVAEVDVHAVGAPENVATVVAPRVIHAAGFDYTAPEPIDLSSKAVRSISPSELSATLATDPDAPVYVVGGGKTGMDTVLAALRGNKARAVTLINGNGTYFLNRTRYFPAGLRRWFAGALPAIVFRDCALMFDGHNEEDLRAHFIATYAANNDPRSKNHVYGILSEDESHQIEAGLQDKLWDYLEDVVDNEAGPVMRMRSGAQVPVAQGSIFVNCTGSIFRQRRPEEHMPCLSPNDVILSINTNEAAHFLTTYSSFILTHLFFCGRLRKAGLYFLDLQVLLQKDRQVFTAATMSQSYLNLLIGLKNLPPASRKHFGMDFNLWYPLPRRILALMGIRKTAREDVRHCRKALDAVVERFGLIGGQMR